MHHNQLERTRRQSARRYRAAVERAWEHLTLSGEVVATELRDHVFSSWRRCVGYGVSPTSQLPPAVASGERLADMREHNRELMLAAQNTWRLLADILADTQSILLVADPRGVVLDVSGDPMVVERARELYVAPGYEWSESASGTNAVGTAIATDQPAEVSSVEHFCSVAKIWACAAAPVRDTVDGSMVGVIDITTFDEGWHGHSLALAVTTAHQIEQTLQSRDLARNVQLLQWYQSNLPRWSNHALLLLDRKGRIITSNGHAQSLFRDRQLVERMVRGAPLLAVGGGRVSELDLAGLPHGLRTHALEAYGHSGEWEGGLLVLDAVRTIAPGQRCLTGATGPEEPLANGAFRAIVAQSAVMEEVKQRAARMAAASAPVLILGETGTGKELIARAVHAASTVASGPFVAVNCGTLTRELAASQLLGYEAGAFTGAAPRGAAGKFEEADGGTLFLDEIAELPAEVQVHLLRVVQDGIVVRVGGHRERQVRVRIVAATNRDLEAAAADGSFRPDLYYRLKVLALELPRLCDRREDIALLAEAAIAEFNERYGLGPKRLAPELLAHLERQPWPGNVRQLRGVIESMYVMASDDRLTLRDLPVEPGSAPATQERSAPVELKTMSGLERDAILAHLDAHAGNRSKVARALGISRSTLYRKLAEYDIA